MIIMIGDHIQRLSTAVICLPFLSLFLFGWGKAGRIVVVGVWWWGWRGENEGIAFLHFFPKVPEFLKSCSCTLNREIVQYQ